MSQEKVLRVYQQRIFKFQRTIQKFRLEIEQMEVQIKDKKVKVDHFDQLIKTIELDCISSTNSISDLSKMQARIGFFNKKKSEVRVDLLKLETKKDQTRVELQTEVNNYVKLVNKSKIVKNHFLKLSR